MRPLGRGRTAAFNDALARAHIDPDAPQPTCIKLPAQYVDYETPPSEAAARDMCRSCPLLDLCRESARVEKPSWGVHGGIAWVNGKQHHWLVKLGHVEAD